MIGVKVGLRGAVFYRFPYKLRPKPKIANFTAVASFSDHFLAPPTWSGNEEYDPAFVSVQLGMFART